MSEETRKKVCKKIDALIEDEDQANKEYGEFAKGLEGNEAFEDASDSFGDMSDDEGDHKKSLLQMKKDLKC